MKYGLCNKQGRRMGRVRCCCAFLLKSDSLVVVCRCFGSVLKVCVAKYGGENCVELAFGRGSVTEVVLSTEGVVSLVKHSISVSLIINLFQAKFFLEIS